MKLGAQLFTVRDYCKDSKSFDQTMKQLSDIGYTSVQVSGIGPIPAADVRNICDNYGLEIGITHVNPDILLNNTCEIIKDHQKYGCKHVGIGALPQRYARDKEGLAAFIKDYTPVAEELKKNGMTFNYHNHSFEFAKIGDKTLLDMMIEETDPSNMFFILDVFWVQHGGGNPVSYIEKLKGRINAIHYKDFVIRGGKQCFAAIGSGNLEWDDIIRVSIDNDIPYAMIEQDNDFIDDPVTELKRSYEYLYKKGLR